MNHQPLFSLTTAGASVHTAWAERLRYVGVAASREIARRDLARIVPLKARFDAASAVHDLPPALLAALASRESHVGALLLRGWGDGGHAYGLLQIDRRYHEVDTTASPDSEQHIQQAAGILASNLATMLVQHPAWSPEWALRGAVAAYNSGASNVKTQHRMDVGTTHGDYSADVWERAKFYATAVWGEHDEGTP